jgi:hypothetical protein
MHMAALACPAAASPGELSCACTDATAAVMARAIVTECNFFIGIDADQANVLAL